MKYDPGYYLLHKDEASVGMWINHQPGRINDADEQACNSSAFLFLNREDHLIVGRRVRSRSTIFMPQSFQSLLGALSV